MNGEIEGVCSRPRPLSGGLWSLFSWLRRGDHSSCESISSVGSARTAASFAFLGPGHYTTATPLLLPPPSSPTDSYKKRVRDRNQRRLTDRDITIHRKYGLYGYDAFSLPNSRRSTNETPLNRCERDRRATSESFPRRTHVPGKRRAPLPPGVTASLARRRAKKRPAPQPPLNMLPRTSTHVKNIEIQNSIPMNSQRPGQPVNQNNEVNLGCKSEKYSKKDAHPKDSKIRHEKNFLKQIFENKKRHSAAETSSLKLLPNISELDKQAAEMIEKYKLKEFDQKSANNPNATPGSSQTESWICTRCLKKYDANVITCLHCLPLPKTFLTDTGKSNIFTQTNESKPLNSREGDLKDKEKLKEMLKEIKNSLPKKENNVTSLHAEGTHKKELIKPVEAPTLRIGSSRDETMNSPAKIQSTSNNILPKRNIEPLATIKNVVITQPLVLEHTSNNVIKVEENKTNEISKPNQVNKVDINKKQKDLNTSKETTKLNTPLKMSSLLNPIYVHKLQNNNDLESNSSKQNSFATPNVTAPKSSKTNLENDIKFQPRNDKEVTKTNNLNPADKANVTKGISNRMENINQHSKRRNLINQLEQSIAKGDERAAAEAAINLAKLKLSCSVLSFSSQIMSEPSTSRAVEIEHNIKDIQLTHDISKEADNSETKDSKDKQIVAKVSKNVVSQASSSREVKIVDNNNKSDSTIQSPKPSTSTAIQHESDTNDVPILVWIEDKEATRGPVQLHVRRDSRLGELRKQTEKSLGLASRLQRWIIGRNLCSDDNMPLKNVAGLDMSAPFYLCLVETDSKNETVQNINGKTVEQAGNVYNELMQLEKMALVTNTETFECGVCMGECIPGNGVVLRECVHSFCKECLSDVVRHSEEPAVLCPAVACHGALQEREIRGLVSPDEYEKWLARGLAVAESGTRNAFHCRTRDCTGWALCDPGVKTFPCPVCKKANCIPCQAIHEGQTCEQHRSMLQKLANTDSSQTDDGTRALLNTMISRGEALECPDCSAIITKKWGCDWIKCSACKTEICWVTRGRRWGPGGRGDTSAGCRCGVDGKKCHPSCGYCH